MHYQRWWRNNDAEKFGMPKPKRRPMKQDVDYYHLHGRLRAERGRASERMCEDCGMRKANHWAYDHSDPSALRSPEGLLYSLDVWNYWALCSSCHQRHDRDIA